MGKRASMFRCRECHETWWEWLEWLSPDDLRHLADTLSCPACDSDDWQLTDASTFAGSSVTVGRDSISTYYEWLDNDDVGPGPLLWADGPYEGKAVDPETEFSGGEDE